MQPQFSCIRYKTHAMSTFHAIDRETQNQIRNHSNIKHIKQQKVNRNAQNEVKIK